MTKDILIIGSGPAGLYAWKMASDLNLTGTVVEANTTYGGQVLNIYPEKTVLNLPAIVSLKGTEVIEQMYKAIKIDEEKINFKAETRVVDLQKIEPEERKEDFENWFKVTFSDGSVQNYKRILITDGVGVNSPIKLTPKDYDNIIYTIKDLNTFIDKDVLIFGGGDSALDWALELAKRSKSVKIIHRRDEFRAKPGSLEAAKELGIELLTPYGFDSISSEQDNIAKSLKLINMTTKEEVIVDFDLALVQFGVTIKKEKFDNLELEFNKMNKIIINEEMSTSVKGIYAAGDCCWYETKLRNLVSCFFEAMHSVINIEKTVNNRKVPNNGW
ncbi:ferredoxin/flavodoxin---NADP+ reductase [Spiroplasma chinense]|uniref:Ferredoxin--NADP reductase n=1 Tax=Spiroplasma chinense TaxID=216932 RepID=A0A5B9Y340_9MOLU|nr:NAD(P)/FAD-dependent oxidoreductase [Spiroplasma chinense]QEH61494.1 ferredoxin/flavodoxin---NADP+ reductase [Spiroplasma chinense]